MQLDHTYHVIGSKYIYLSTPTSIQTKYSLDNTSPRFITEIRPTPIPHIPNYKAPYSTHNNRISGERNVPRKFIDKSSAYRYILEWNVVQVAYSRWHNFFTVPGWTGGRRRFWEWMNEWIFWCKIAMLHWNSSKEEELDTLFMRQCRSWQYPLVVLLEGFFYKKVDLC